MYDKEIFKADIFMINLNIYNEKYSNQMRMQQGERPGIVTSSIVACKYSPVINIVPLTGSTTKTNIPVHVNVGVECGLLKPSIALIESEISLDRAFFMRKIGHCSDEIMAKIENAIQMQRGITNPFDTERAYSLLKAIKDADRYIEKHNLCKKEVSFRNALVNEFKYYCQQCNVGYKSIIQKYNQSVTNNKHQEILSVVNA